MSRGRLILTSHIEYERGVTFHPMPCPGHREYVEHCCNVGTAGHIDHGSLQDPHPLLIIGLPIGGARETKSDT